MELTEIYKKYKECSSVSTDTRTISNNTLFFALKGDNFNGNKFVKSAFDKGAKYCVVDEKEALINNRCILVENSLKTLQKLANYHRNQLNYPIIALTGSNGKTTTKELIKHVLETTFKVKATSGNYNNHIGVPLTLLSFPNSLEFGIVEMGANHQKEIAFLCEIAEPDFGLITNYGKAHLEGFGGVKGIIKGKSELYDFLKSNDKYAFINKEDKEQVIQIGDYNKTITFGSSDSDINISYINAKPYVKAFSLDTTIQSNLIGTYNFGNIAIAIAIGIHFNISIENIKKGIEGYIPSNNRSEIIIKGNNQILLDAYNANPSSMMAALQNFKNLETKKKKVVFLGDMFELGTEAKKEHQNIVNYVENEFEHIYIIGENFSNTSYKSTTNNYNNFMDLSKQFDTSILNDSYILIKGSRGMALERILDLI